MNTSRTYSLRVVTCALVLAACMHDGRAALRTPALVAAVVSADPAVATAAAAELRALGPAGLRAVMDANADQIQQARAGAPLPPDWDRLRTAIDRVAGQRDAYSSGLYWYTDLAAARHASTERGRPILALRLLGRLDQELSCANSRYFRTALYANADVSRYLAEHFVLYWSTERPVPVVTVDFGDGRTIRTTLTGNSVHYVLDAKGRVVDALPGLYGPRAFLRGLVAAERDALELTPLDDIARRVALTRIAGARIEDAKHELGQRTPDRGLSLDQPNASPVLLAENVTISKSVVETPMVGRFVIRLEDDSQLWEELAAAAAADAQLDEGGRMMVRRHLASEFVHADGSVDEDGFAKTIALFERDVAIDTVRNRLKYRPMIQAILRDEPTASFEELNRRVYETVFLMTDDPWYDLRSPERFTGLENGGIIKTGK